jgi:hypothetical protein
VRQLKKDPIQTAQDVQRALQLDVSVATICRRFKDIHVDVMEICITSQPGTPFLIREDHSFEVFLLPHTSLPQSAKSAPLGPVVSLLKRNSAVLQDGGPAEPCLAFHQSPI